MLSRDLPGLVTRVSTLLSLLLFTVCIGAAIYLYREQAVSAEELGENIGSRRVARDLQITLNKIIEVVGGGGEVQELNRRVHKLLTDANRLADKEEEKKLVSQIEQSYERYERPRQGAGDDGNESRKALEKTLSLVTQLVNFNADLIEVSEARHRQTVGRMAVGLAAAGTVGSLVGILLGYSLARRLRHSIYQMSICVRDAAGKLGQDLPTVNLSGTGDLLGLREQMSGVVRDIEQVVERLQQREREVLRAEQLAAVGQLAASAAHELRNPLTSIKLLVQSDREKAEQRGLPSMHLSIIEQEIRRMERSLQMFMDFARPPKPDFRRLSLATVVERALALVSARARKQNVTVKFHAVDPAIACEADGEQLHQLLVNLTLNALDVMPQGGTLEVGLRQADDGQVEIEVADTGPGIAADVLPRIFEPFVTTKETGSGLGLVVSRRIAENHRGSLAVHNRPEGGACFTLRLPGTPVAAASVS